jgi:hypothetical protein
MKLILRARILQSTPLLFVVKSVEVVEVETNENKQSFSMKFKEFSCISTENTV